MRSDQSAGSVWTTSPIALVFTIRMFTGIRLPKVLHLHVQRADFFAGDELFPVVPECILPQGFESESGVDHFIHASFVDSGSDVRREINAILLNHILKFAHILAVILIYLVEDEAVTH